MYKLLVGYDGFIWTKALSLPTEEELRFFSPTRQFWHVVVLPTERLAVCIPVL